MATLKDTVINANSAVTIPSGTTAQRPGSPEAGMIRFNTELAQLEGYNGSDWQQLATPKFEPSTFVTYNGAGANQTFTVPSGKAKIRVWAWGAGGGGGNTGSSGGEGGFGAGGGMIYVPELDVTSGENLTVVVGSGSSTTASNGSTVHPNFDFSTFVDSGPVYGGGGAAGRGEGAGSNGAYGGAGGGASGIKRGSTWLLRAYGGAGGGGGAYANTGTTAGNGPSNSSGGSDNNGPNGTRGGNGVDGGGGGGSGGDGSSYGNRSGIAGNNGSFVEPAITGTVTYNNSGRTPGNSSDPNYISGRATGGNRGGSGTNLTGTDGIVVIGY